MKKNIIMFVLGAAAGSLFACLYYEKKYSNNVCEGMVVDDHYDHVIHRNETPTEVVETESERKVLVMNKDRYKKVINNYSNSPEVLEPAPKAVRSLPYVITFEEFCEDYEGHDKSTLTYYNADGVLVDEDETPVEDPNWTIGAETTDKFGVGSDDPDVVYVRNEKLKMDYEVIRLEGAYNTEEDL